MFEMLYLDVVNARDDCTREAEISAVANVDNSVPTAPERIPSLHAL